MGGGGESKKKERKGKGEDDVLRNGIAWDMTAVVRIASDGSRS